MFADFRGVHTPTKFDFKLVVAEEPARKTLNRHWQEPAAAHHGNGCFAAASISSSNSENRRSKRLGELHDLIHCDIQGLAQIRSSMKYLWTKSMLGTILEDHF